MFNFLAVLVSVSDLITDMTDDNDENSEPDDHSVVDLLLQHKRCANHILNLQTATDSLKAQENAQYKRAYGGAMSKFQALSNAVHRSTRHADIVDEEVGLMFLNPT